MCTLYSSTGFPVAIGSLFREKIQLHLQGLHVHDVALLVCSCITVFEVMSITDGKFPSNKTVVAKTEVFVTSKFCCWDRDFDDFFVVVN